jgi:mRNA-degrading endonuclease RelE of RelBE toxin-antitoxin system
MVTVSFHPDFQKTFSKIKEKSHKDRLIKLFCKIRDNPEVGKPMMYTRKGTREVYMPPYRLSYLFLKEEDRIVLLDLYHKDEQ